MFMHALEIRNVGVLFVVGTVNALFGPILIEMIADRYTVTHCWEEVVTNNVENAPLPIFSTRFGALGPLGWHRNRNRNPKNAGERKVEHLGGLEVDNDPPVSKLSVPQIKKTWNQPEHLRVPKKLAPPPTH